MTIVFYSETDDPQPWRAAFARAFPYMPFRVWPETGPVDAVRYALAWNPPPGLLARFPNLIAVLSLGAGVDGFLSDPDLPGVPLVRLLDAGLAPQMAEYAVYSVLHFQRRMPEYLGQQSRTQWRQLEPVLAQDWTVGVMGLGVIGGSIAKHIAGLGFPVRGWSRTPRLLDGVESFHGQDGLVQFLSTSKVVVNVLPLTRETAGILGAHTFAHMPRGSFVVNIGRGGHLVEADLLVALDSGQIGGAMLDVFGEEPLPSTHPFWAHPQIVVTPHIAGVTIASEAEAQVIENIKRLERGEPPEGLVDRAKGY